MAHKKAGGSSRNGRDSQAKLAALLFVNVALRCTRV